MRVAFIISTMSSGGAERVASVLCNYLVRQGFEVNLVLFELHGTESHYHIDKEVVIPAKSTIGYNLKLDKKRFVITASGIVIVAKKSFISS